jgi:hypothetical protein
MCRGGLLHKAAAFALHEQKIITDLRSGTLAVEHSNHRANNLKNVLASVDQISSTTLYCVSELHVILTQSRRNDTNYHVHAR